jgi:GH25 family lysozyme M1 (1,4-beta-N-acetylmuramidase)
LSPRPRRMAGARTEPKAALPPLNHNRASLASVGDWVLPGLGLSVLHIKLVSAFAAAFFAAIPTISHAESQMNAAWMDPSRALVLDGYEYNSFDLKQISKNPRVAGFIHKGSDGLPPRYGCPDSVDLTAKALCKKDWKVYSVGRELFNARRGLAKSLGLKWGAYHMGRPGNPREQANHFLDFAEPAADDLMALDLEDNDPAKFMSLADAEEFARHINRRTGRYPLLYTNGSTAKFIAENAETYPLLSKLKIWYARYKPDIVGHFPKGEWENYTLWQFASSVNCGDTGCPYRISGTGKDIDINVADMSPAELRKAWPFNGLSGEQPLNPAAARPTISFISTGKGAGIAAVQAAAVLRWSKKTMLAREPAPINAPDFGIDMLQTASVSVAFYDYPSQRRCSRVISRQPMSVR